MRYKLTAIVDGDLVLEEQALSHELDGILYELKAGPGGKVATASVSCAVPAHKRDKFRSTMERAEPSEGVSARVHIGGDRELFGELVSALKNLESSFGHTSDGPTVVRHIRWDEPEHEFIPEGPEDEALVGIFNVKYSPPARRQSFRIGAVAFTNTVVAAKLYEPLQYTASLYREADARFHDGQYVDALHYCFLALEDLFADGHTGKKQTLAAFKANPLCRRVMDRALGAFSGDHPAYRAVRQMFEDHRDAWAVDGAIAFVYDMRGQLGHAASRRRRFKGVLTHQADFRPLALFLVYMVQLALMLRKVQITRAAEGLPPEPD